MMVYESSVSAWDNSGKFIHQFQPERKTFIRKLERFLIRLYRQNVSLLFNQTCLNKRLLSNNTYTIYIYIYIYIYVCVCVCVCMCVCEYSDKKKGIQSLIVFIVDF